MREFKADAYFNISGRGLVAVATLPENFEWDCQLGDHILVDEKEYVLSGVERYSKLMAPPIPGNKVGLLIKPVPTPQVVVEKTDGKSNS